MGTPQKMQHYMERHRLSSLFEDLMNKVLHDQPENPIIHMIKILYKKAGMDIPTELKLGAVRRSSPERIVRSNKSPEMTRKSTTQAWASSSVDPTGRSYNKPWLSHSKKPKTKETEEKELPKPVSPRNVSKHLFSESNLRPQSTSAVRPCSTSALFPQSSSLRPQSANLRPQTAIKSPSSPRRGTESSPLEGVLRVTPISPGRKQKQAWNSDNKVGSSSFDDLFEETGKTGATKGMKKTDISPTDARKAWATIGLEGDDVQYTSTNYRGPRTNRNDDDPLAGEIMNAKAGTATEESTKVFSSGHVRGRHVDAKKHQKELQQLLTEKNSNDSGFIDEENEKEDNAIELLEDGEELRKEGARNISATGYKLSRILKERQQEANVKLNINLYTGPQPADSLVADIAYEDNQDKYFDSEDERPPTGMSGYQGTPGDSDVDEEFESVSQVTGPRRPVWNVMDSDGESYIPKPSKTLPEPSRSKSTRGMTDRLNSSVPVRFKDDSYPSQSMESADSFLPAGKTWTPGRTSEVEMGNPRQSMGGESVRSEKGGWTVPRYDSDASILDWSTTGKPEDLKKPRVY